MERFPGLYRAQVLENRDPDKLGRLKVSFATLDAAATTWARPCLPPSQIHAPFVPPDIGEAVWLMFESGDIDRPVWIGWAWTSGATNPPTYPAGF